MILGPISEVILYVEEMNRQVAFYKETLGLEVTYPKDRTDYTGEIWVTFATGDCTLALHGGGKGRRGEDAPSFVFEVDNIVAVRERLAERGVAIGEVQEVGPGIVIAKGSDPEGNRFSLESQA